jgi:CubicO group peptidase (beta-lactamase class C family)
MLPQSAHQIAEILSDAVSKKDLTAWSFANQHFCVSSFFADECEPPLEGNCDWLHSIHPTFDLASLTKPLFTNSYLRACDPNFATTLHTPLCELLKNPRTPAGEVLRSALQNSRLTLADFLNHRTGVPPWMWFGKGDWHFAPGEWEAKAHALAPNPNAFRERIEETLTRFAAQKLSSQQVQESYSDIGYFLMARLVENIFTDKHATWPERLGFLNTQNGTEFSHASLSSHEALRAIPSYPYTALQNQNIPQGAFQKREFGLVHDTNASMLAQHGVVSGHAGFFGNVLDVALAIPLLAQTQHALLKTHSPKPGSRFVYGLDTPSNEQSAAGPRSWPLPEGERIFGHLGYTGTMFWFSQNANEALTNFKILLTNRTAHRTTIGPESAPRILVFTPMPQTLSRNSLHEHDNSQSHYFVQSQPGSALKPLSRNDAEETIVAHARSTTRVWNDACVRPVPNIQNLRNSVAKLLEA